MAGWVAGVEMCSHVCLCKGFLEVAIIFIAICIHLQELSTYAQDSGEIYPFLSIDCGNTLTNYTDNYKLKWVADNETFIKTGQNSEERFVNSSLHQSLLSYRFFPEYRSKHCYNLPTPNLFYGHVVRASFYLNEPVLKEFGSFKFTVAVDATAWFTITNGDDSDTELFIVQEGIFYPPSELTYFCLLPELGVPFISSLELRVIDDVDVYLYSGAHSQYLSLSIRLNTGANSSAPDVRHPEDPYDRIWKTPDATWDNAYPIISTPVRIENVTDVSTYYVPPIVMQDGWKFPADGSDQAVFPAYVHGAQVSLVDPGQYSFVVVYSQFLNSSSPEPYGLGIQLDINQTFYGEYFVMSGFSSKITASPIMNFYPGSDSISISLVLYDPRSKTVNVTIPNGPTMNAVEIYSQAIFNMSATNSDDDEVIAELKTGFSLSDWQGDPCVPVPHDWLTCELNNTHGVSQYYVTSVTLSNVTTSGFSNLTLQQVRPNNLNTMSITQSGVDSHTFQMLHLYISPGLSTLNLSYNALTTLPPELAKITGSLTDLDLSHNQLKDDISSVDQWVQVNSQTLQQLNVSNNKLSGVFNSSLYFSQLPSLTTALIGMYPPEMIWDAHNQEQVIRNFSQNLIEGTLDLTAWYDSLQAASQSTFQNMTRVTLQLYSFVNNNVSYITPNVENFAAPIQHLLDKWPYFFGRGILLGGNPFCRNAKSFTQRYLCRSSIDQIVQMGNDNKQKIMIVSIISGVVGLLVFAVIFATLWRLWKQVYTLREIQRALADRQVQPPFYQYNDIKVATRDFHTSNRLGIGGFGVVYKAILADQSSLAVKTLFDSQSEQAIDEFLNEVVLITGIKHRNLVQLKGCCIKDKQRMLVYEYAENGNLAEALWGSKAHGGLNWEMRFKICVGVARGLSYLHEELQPSIIHRDIKPENILLDKEFKPKIADFGLARRFLGEASQAQYTQISKVAGTRGYFAPEYAMHGQLSEKADVYSYGILILEVVCGRKCIDMSLPIEQKILVDWVGTMKKQKTLFDVLQPELRDNCVFAEAIRAINIGLLCTQHDPEKRPSMSQVVTMLLGSIDIEVLNDLELGDDTSSFDNVFANIDHEYPTSHTYQFLPEKFSCA